jgi:hypothetical protein
MSLTPSIEIVITDVVTSKELVITSVVATEIDSTWKALTDTAKITMPRNIRVLNGDINSIIKRGSSVSISMGYDGVMNQEFTGYVSRLNSKIPFDIFCEDEMWQLKQTNFTKTFGKTTLKEIVSFIYPGDAQVIDMQLPSYRIDRTTAAKVLASLKEQYGIISYFQNGLLNVGFAYDLSLKNEVIYHFQQNCLEDGNELEYKLPEDYKVQVKGTSLQPGGKIISYTATDTGGEEYNPQGKTKFDGDTITLNNIPPGLSKDQLQRIVDDQIKKYKIGGYQGSIKAFGTPFVRHGDIAHFIDRLYPEREGLYFIDHVKVSYGEGFRRTIEPGRKVLS